MSLTNHVSAQYGLVLAAATSTFFVNILHMSLTSSARKASGIKVPIAYASAEQAEKDPKAFLFNCAQRAHINFNEQHTTFLGALLISGLRYPVLSASLGALWTVSRIHYALSYALKGPKARSLGFRSAALATVTLICTAAYSSVQYALGQ